MKKIILASASPRRKALLEQCLIPVSILPADVDESCAASSPEEFVTELSGRKCMNVLERTAEDTVVIGADTVVAFQDSILGKPEDEEEAAEMLRMLQGREHQVFTGVTIAEKADGVCLRKTAFTERSDVKFYPLKEAEIREYIDTGEPLDKAGAYGIQGVFARHVEWIRGDYFNIVGLPVAAVYNVLKAWDVL